MYDRIPSPGKENRVSITQDNGQVITGVLAYADDATQEGSAYTKGNVLPDDVCFLMDLDFDESEPDDAFRYLALMNATVYGGIAIRVISNGLPLSGITFSVTGTGSVTTDSQGYVFLRKPPGNYTATFSNTLDLIFSPSSLRVVSTAGKINSYTVEANEASVTQQTFTGSTTINFSDRVSDFDVFCVGGGGSGGAGVLYSLTSAALSGGAGGYTSTALGIENTGADIGISIGSGGASAVSTGGSRAGNNGGTTTVTLGGSVICTAKGGESGRSSVGSFPYAESEGADGGSGSGSAQVSDQGNARVNKSGSNGSDGGISGILVPSGKGQGTTTTAFGSGTPYSPAGAGAAARVKNGSMGDYDTGTSVTGAGDAVVVVTQSASYGRATAEPGEVAGAGGGSAILVAPAGSGGSFTATSGAGSPGLVIIRWRYK